MCGIAGVISPDRLTESDLELVRGMNARLLHRGPDAAGLHVGEHVALAMRRLSIIDLTGGWQPLYNESRDVAVVCNGEIYNHVALRRKLAGRGHRFSSASDVEAIVHIYEDQGLDCVRELRGMFAFALWDQRRQRLVLARDRMGEKPLYLHRDSKGKLWFSSELQSLVFSMRESRPCLSPRALNLFLTFQYVPEPETPLEGVEICRQDPC